MTKFHHGPLTVPRQTTITTARTTFSPPMFPPQDYPFREPVILQPGTRYWFNVDQDGYAFVARTEVVDGETPMS